MRDREQQSSVLMGALDEAEIWQRSPVRRWNYLILAATYLCGMAIFAAFMTAIVAGVWLVIGFVQSLFGG